MVCSQVMGNNLTISIAAANGHLELNVFKPVIEFNLCQSINLLSDSVTSFCKNCLIGIKANKDIIKKNLENSHIFFITSFPLFRFIVYIL